MEEFSLFNLLIEILIAIAALYITWRLFSISRSTGDRITSILLVAFVLFDIATLGDLIIRDALGLNFLESTFESELFHDTLFLLAMLAFALILLPRRAWKSRLKPMNESEMAKKEAA